MNATMTERLTAAGQVQPLESTAKTEGKERKRERGPVLTSSESESEPEARPAVKKRKSSFVATESLDLVRHIMTDVIELSTTQIDMCQSSLAGRGKFPGHFHFVADGMDQAKTNIPFSIHERLAECDGEKSKFVAKHHQANSFL